MLQRKDHQANNPSVPPPFTTLINGEDLDLGNDDINTLDAQRVDQTLTENAANHTLNQEVHQLSK